MERDKLQLSDHIAPLLCSVILVGELLDVILKPHKILLIFLLMLKLLHFEDVQIQQLVALLLIFVIEHFHQLKLESLGPANMLTAVDDKVFKIFHSLLGRSILTLDKVRT